MAFNVTGSDDSAPSNSFVFAVLIVSFIFGPSILLYCLYKRKQAFSEVHEYHQANNVSVRKLPQYQTFNLNLMKNEVAFMNLSHGQAQFSSSSSLGDDYTCQVTVGCTGTSSISNHH